MNRRDRLQLEDLAVDSAQNSYRLHPGMPLSRHVRVALHTYQAGLPPDDLPDDEPDPVVEPWPRWMTITGAIVVLLCFGVGFVAGYAS